MIIFPSNKVADLVNVTLANTWGTTTTADGATSDGLICNEDLSNIVQCGAEINNALTKSPSMFYNAVTKMLETVSDNLFIHASYFSHKAPSSNNISSLFP